MKTFASAELYVLRQSEGGQLATLRSGCNAILDCEGLEVEVFLELSECENLRAGESGMANLTLLQDEAPQLALSVGETFVLSIDGDRAAIGQILNTDSDGACEENDDVATVSPEVVNDPPRLVVLLGSLIGGLFVLLFVRDAGALWQKLIAFAVTVAAVVVWSVYSELNTAREDEYRDEPADGREPPNKCY